MAVRTTLEIVRAAVPVFCSVTACAALVVLSACAANVRLVTDALIWGAVAKPVNAQVPRNGIDPSGRRPQCRIEQLGLAPHRQHRLLREFLGDAFRASGLDKKPFDTWGECTEKRSEGRSIATLCDRLKPGAEIAGAR